MAEALVNHFLAGQWQAFSAGTHPAGYVHPLALRALEELGIHHRGVSKSVNAFKDQAFDVIITVCDDAHEHCPVWWGMGTRVHIGYPDPAKTEGTEAERLAVFRQVRDGMKDQLLTYLQTC